LTADSILGGSLAKPPTGGFDIEKVGVLVVILEPNKLENFL
jgi:hypothetical protein